MSAPQITAMYGNAVIASCCSTVLKAGSTAMVRISEAGNCCGCGAGADRGILLHVEIATKTAATTTESMVKSVLGQMCSLKFIQKPFHLYPMGFF